MLTDPIADYLTRIRNAVSAEHRDVEIPASRLKKEMTRLLQEQGYIEGYAAQDDPTRPGRVMEITMKYSPDRDRTISGLRRVSKPGLRVYIKADKLPRVLGGLGVAVLSTSHGLMTDREARQRRVGGEVLCYVW